MLAELNDGRLSPAPDSGIEGLRILHLEDDLRDRELVRSAIDAEGIECEIVFANGRHDFEALLVTGRFDLILSDFTLPSYDGASALTLAQKHCPEVPYVFVSGTIGEERAVESLKLGATDYVLKNRMENLVPAIRRALREASERARRKKVEEALKQSEARYRGFIEGAKDAIFLIGMDCCILSANKAAEEITGWIREAWSGRPFSEFLSADDKERVEGYLRKALGGEMIPTFEVRMCTLQGSHVPLEFTLTKQFESGKPAGILGIGRDVTERHRLQTQILQMQRMESIGRLAGGVAHDFNNILSIIECHAWQMQNTLKLEEAAVESVKEISAAAKRAADLTRQLLTFSRQQIFQPHNVLIENVVDDLTKMLKRVIGADIALTVQHGGSPGIVCADTGMMEQVLLNLAINSRDAMPDGGHLEISTNLVQMTSSRRQSGVGWDAGSGLFVRLSVIDSGCGIEAENLSKIFEPFFTTKEVGKGTGLGLATVYGIVEQHGGWIDVSSEMGKGTRFDIYLPCCAGEVEKPNQKTSETRTRGGTETILVVEDETALQSLVVEILRDYGYRVLAADSGIEAVAQWRKHKGDIDMLLTDLVMPHGMNGRELASFLQKEKPGLGVAFTSGYSAAVLPNQFSMGEEEFIFIQKPYHPRTLIKTIREVLDRRSSMSTAPFARRDAILE